MRKLLAAWVALAMLAIPAASQAATNPASYQGHPMSCPDPDVFNYGKLYVAACTSDFGQYNPLPRGGMGRYRAAFPIYVSSDLKSWRFVNYILPPGHAPWFLAPPTGNWPGGEYWAPEIHRIDGWWVAYYGAQLAGSHKWVIVQSWTKNLFGGNWGSKVLVNDPTIWGTIDPSVAPDPQHPGTYDIVWMGGGGQVRIAQLDHTGGRFISSPRVISYPTLGWEHGWEEGPVIWPEWNNGRILGVDALFVNAASTWDNSYAVALEQAVNPLQGNWQKFPTPLLHSGGSLVSTGIGAQPFVGPHDQLMLAFHVQLGQGTHNMEGRWLSFAPLLFHGNVPYVAAGGSAPRLY